MESRRKHALGALALVGFMGAVLAGGFSLVTAGFGDMCGNEPIAEVVSPRGGHRAVVFGRSCGATTGFSTQVSVLPAREDLPADRGNVFAADDDHGAAPEGPGGGPAVEVVWWDEERLVIRHHPKARVFRAEERIGRVAVAYEQR